MKIQYELPSFHRHHGPVVHEKDVADWVHESLDGPIEQKLTKLTYLVGLLTEELLKARPDLFQQVVYHIDDTDASHHKLVE